jgi:hypothetical protein
MRSRLWLLMAGCAALLGGGAVLGVTGGCGPLPGERPAGAPPPDIVTLHTGDGRYFYLVDTRRALCFFGDRYRPQLTRLDCAELPEAAELLGWEPAAPGTEDDEPGAPPLSAPGDDAPDTVEPPPRGAPAGPPPTPAERQQFEQAFVERFCAIRRPADADEGPPDEPGGDAPHGLTPERYDQVRDHLSADEVAWRALSEKALAACP